MAELVVGEDEVTVRLRTSEKIGALHGDLTVARSAVQRSCVVERPFDHLRGLRLPGTCVPWSIAVGSWRAKGVRDFVAVHRRRPAVLVELDPALAGGWTRLIVSVDDPDAVNEPLQGDRCRRVRPLVAPRS